MSISILVNHTNRFSNNNFESQMGSVGIYRQIFKHDSFYVFIYLDRTATFSLTLIIIISKQFVD